MSQPDDNQPESVNWLQAVMEKSEAAETAADAENQAFARALFHPNTEETS